MEQLPQSRHCLFSRLSSNKSSKIQVGTKHFNSFCPIQRLQQMSQQIVNFKLVTYKQLLFFKELHPPPQKKNKKNKRFLGYKSCNLFKIVLVLLFASVKRFFVSGVRDFSSSFQFLSCFLNQVPEHSSSKVGTVTIPQGTFSSLNFPYRRLLQIFIYIYIFFQSLFAMVMLVVSLYIAKYSELDVFFIHKKNPALERISQHLLILTLIPKKANTIKKQITCHLSCVSCVTGHLSHAWLCFFLSCVR